MGFFIPKLELQRIEILQSEDSIFLGQWEARGFGRGLYIMCGGKKFRRDLVAQGRRREVDEMALAKNKVRPLIIRVVITGEIHVSDCCNVCKNVWSGKSDRFAMPERDLLLRAVRSFTQYDFDSNGNLNVLKKRSAFMCLYLEHKFQCFHARTLTRYLKEFSKSKISHIQQNVHVILIRFWDVEIRHSVLWQRKFLRSLCNDTRLSLSRTVETDFLARFISKPCTDNQNIRHLTFGSFMDYTDTKKLLTFWHSAVSGNFVVFRFQIAKISRCIPNEACMEVYYEFPYSSLNWPHSLMQINNQSLFCKHFSFTVHVFLQFVILRLLIKETTENNFDLADWYFPANVGTKKLLTFWNSAVSGNFVVVRFQIAKFSRCMLNKACMEVLCIYSCEWLFPLFDFAVNDWGFLSWVIGITNWQNWFFEPP